MFMSDGGVPLSRHPGPRVIYQCDPCGRRGVYSKARLIAEHGDIGLPRLASILSETCRAGLGSARTKYCRANFPMLAPRAHEKNPAG